MTKIDKKNVPNVCKFFQTKNVRNKDKPLLRTKSELPQSNETIRALIDHRRADDILKAPTDENQC